MSTKIILIILIFQISYSQSDGNRQKNIDDLITLGKKQGYNFTNSKDKFYYDICQRFTSDTKKDVTLEYRRKYYYFPEQKLIDNNIGFEKNLKGNEEFPPIKIKNNPDQCGDSWDYHLVNPQFYLILILLFGQLMLLELIILFKKKQIWNKSPLELIKKVNEIKNPKEKKAYLNNFIIQTLENINEINKFPEMLSDENKQNNTTNFAQLIEEEDTKNDFSSAVGKKPLNNNNTNQKNNVIAINNEENTKGKNNPNSKDVSGKTGRFDDDTANNDINANVNEIIEGGINKQAKIAKKSDEDNYTFGGGIYSKKITNITKQISEENKEDNENNGKDAIKSFSTTTKLTTIKDKKQVEDFIYKKINHNKYIEYNNSSTYPKQLDLIFSKEELFYKGYNFALLEDKRSVFQIYKDILSYCQIWFVFNAKVKIYEDIKVIIVYYCTKIELHLLINAKLMNNNEINKIYDGKFFLNNYFYHFFISAFISTIIGEILFVLLNSKRLYIKQKNQVNSLRVFDIIKKTRLSQITTDLVSDDLFHKISFFSLFAIILIITTFKNTVPFSSIFINSRYYYYICVIGSIILSQLSPFVLALIPAYLRKKAIEEKNYFKYKILIYIELLYLP